MAFIHRCLQKNSFLKPQHVSLSSCEVKRIELSHRLCCSISRQYPGLLILLTEVRVKKIRLNIFKQICRHNGNKDGGKGMFSVSNLVIFFYVHRTNTYMLLAFELRLNMTNLSDVERPNAPASSPPLGSPDTTHSLLTAEMRQACYGAAWDRPK